VSEVLQATLTLFMIFDPPGNTPFFVSELRGVPEERQKKVIWRELFFALGVLLVFLFAGPFVLDVLKLSQQAVGIGGGIIMFLISIKMIFPPRDAKEPEEPTEEPFLVPLAIPLVAGPSALATLLLMRRTFEANLAGLVLAVVLAWAMSAAILSQAPRMVHILGERGLIALERLFGMILVTIAVQMLLDNLKVAFLGA